MLKLWIRQTVTKRIEQKSNWINERRIRWKKKKKEFPALREKQYSCLTDNNDEDKKSKIKKKNPKFEDYQV